MLFKTDIEIVTGFLGSGKTTFINALLVNTLVKKEKVLILQCEQGAKSINTNFIKDSEVITETFVPNKSLYLETLSKSISVYKPHRIIIEHNGSININELFNLLSCKEISKSCRLLSTYNITDALTYELYINNMGNLILDSISNSDLILLNNTTNIPKYKLKQILNQLEKLNHQSFILCVSNINEVSRALRSTNILYNGLLKRLNIFIKNKL